MEKKTFITLCVLVVIALVFIFFAFFTETEIRIEVNSKDTTSEYVTYEECALREAQKCPTGCETFAIDYCESLELPSPTYD